MLEIIGLALIVAGLLMTLFGDKRVGSSKERGD
jgi:hypothetical protein